MTGRTPAAKNPQHFGDLLPFLTPSDMDYARRDIVTERFLSEEGAGSFQRAVVPAQSVSIVCIGATIGKACLTTQPTLTNQQVNSVVCDQAICAPSFLYYLLTTHTDDLKGIASGAATPIINKTSFSNFEVALPSLTTQRRIAGILSAYDDLIAVNERRIAVLEEMARRVFESRVRDRSNDFLPFSEVADFINGFAFKPSHHVDTGRPVVKIPELKNGITAKTPFADPSIVPERLHMNDGDLLFSWSGTLAVNMWAQGPALLNQHLFRVIPYKVERGYMLFALRDAVERMLEEAVGATMKHIRRSTLTTTLTPLPHADESEDVMSWFASTYDLLLATRKTLINLRTTRDLLLPRLVSGEIDVSDALAPASLAAE